MSMPPATHADRAAVERPVMRRAVDAARQAGDDHRALLAEVVRQPAREAARGRRGIARADDGDRGALEQAKLPLGHEQRRRVVHLGQQARVEPLPEHQIARAQLLDRARSRARHRRG